MACCSEFQTECLRVVTIKYLNDFIGDNVKDTSGNVKKAAGDDTYCPTYSELTGGSLIPNWEEGSSPYLDIDGIKVTGSYAGNQLVRQEDLQVKYTKIKTLTISKSVTRNLKACGESITLGYTYNYERHVKSMDSSCNVDDTATTVNGKCSELKYHTDFSGLTNSGSSVTNCTTYTIGKNGALDSTHSRRCDNVYAEVTFRGETTKSNELTICQAALTGSCSVFSARTPTGVSAYATGATTWNDCDDHSFCIRATGYYTDTYYYKDECGKTYPRMTCTVDGSEPVGGGSIYCNVSGPPSLTCSGTAQFNITKSGGGGGDVACDSFSSHDCCDGASNIYTDVYAYYGGYSDYVRFRRYCSDCSSDKDICPDPDQDTNTTQDSGT